MQSLRIPRDKWAGPRAGQCKLNGKKFLVCTCGCCVVKDLREGVVIKEKNEEINAFKQANAMVSELSKKTNAAWEMFISRSFGESPYNKYSSAGETDSTP